MLFLSKKPALRKVCRHITRPQVQEGIPLKVIDEFDEKGLIERGSSRSK